jgi:hypothetical protein
VNLHPAIGGSKGNRYCGPAALAILTGLDTGQAAANIRRLSGKSRVIGTSVTTMLRTLKALGYTPTQTTDARWTQKEWRKLRPTLQNWAAGTTCDVFLVNITGHWLVYDGRSGEVCDNHTIYPLHVGRYKFRRRFMRAAWRIDRRPEGLTSERKSALLRTW